MKTDFLVIGSGAAGLSFALKAAAHGHVTIVTKGEINECNTNYAQGGICSVTYAPDTFENISTTPWSAEPANATKRPSDWSCAGPRS